jgi:hypothetical protein
MINTTFITQMCVNSWFAKWMIMLNREHRPILEWLVHYDIVNCGRIGIIIGEVVGEMRISSWLDRWS